MATALASNRSSRRSCYLAGPAPLAALGWFWAGLLIGMARSARAESTAAIPTHGVEGEPSRKALSLAEIEERAEKLADRRDKLDYFYISAFVAILVFTFNDFNKVDGILRYAPLWLIEIGWGALILAALCPLYAMRIRLRRIAINMDELSGQPLTSKRKREVGNMRRRVEKATAFMTLSFLGGIIALALAYGIGLANFHGQ